MPEKRKKDDREFREDERTRDLHAGQAAALLPTRSDPKNPVAATATAGEGSGDFQWDGRSTSRPTPKSTSTPPLPRSTFRITRPLLSIVRAAPKTSA